MGLDMVIEADAIRVEITDDGKVYLTNKVTEVSVQVFPEFSGYDFMLERIPYKKPVYK
jgi:hypothetical protein